VCSNFAILQWDGPLCSYNPHCIAPIRCNWSCVFLQLKSQPFLSVSCTITLKHGNPFLPFLFAPKISVISCIFWGQTCKLATWIIRLFVLFVSHLFFSLHCALASFMRVYLLISIWLASLCSLAPCPAISIILDTFLIFRALPVLLHHLWHYAPFLFTQFSLTVSCSLLKFGCYVVLSHRSF